MKLDEMAQQTTTRARAHKNLDRFITSMVAMSQRSIQDYQQDEGERMTQEGIREMVWDYVAEAMTDPEQAHEFDGAIVAAILAELRGRK